MVSDTKPLDLVIPKNASALLLNGVVLGVVGGDGTTISNQYRAFLKSLIEEGSKAKELTVH